MFCFRNNCFVIDKMSNDDEKDKGAKTVKHKGGDVLAREDFDGGPISLDLIETYLYLGNLTAAVTVDTLIDYKITHILTVDTCPLPRRVTDLPNIKSKFIRVADVQREDILEYFEEAYEFIRDGQENGTVLVHCYFGVSRSSAFVIAYLMKKYEMAFESAYKLVKSRRKFCNPNQGFFYQLKLYEKMGWKIDKNFAKYREFRLKVASEKVRKAKILPQKYADLVKSDPGLTQVRPEPLVYRCRKCRRIVASQSNIIGHIEMETREKYKAFSKNKEKENPQGTSKAAEENDKSDEEGACAAVGCQDLDGDQQMCKKTYFVEPLAWMKRVTQTTQGKLYCPKCNSKLGSYSWVMGCQCPCGVTVAPAFYLVPKKVEWSNVVQNVQITV